jgi:hypothetical protein
MEEDQEVQNNTTGGPRMQGTCTVVLDKIVRRLSTI